MEKNKIQFKPLHEGMGFHPFSDGLPYAPESKAAAASKPTASAPVSAPRVSTPTTGTGATAAGRPQFATARQLKQIQEQHSVTPALVIPTAARTGTPSPVSKIITTQIAPGPRPQPAKAPEPAAAPTLQASDSKLILRRRIFAYLLDTVIHTGFWVATNLAALFFFHFQIDADIVQEHFSQFLVFFLISQWLFIALQEMLFETTVGKAFFNLEFKRNHHSLFLRSIVFMGGVAAAGIGFYYRPQDYLGQLQLKTKLYS